MSDEAPHRASVVIRCMSSIAALQAEIRERKVLYEAAVRMRNGFFAQECRNQKMGVDRGGCVFSAAPRSRKRVSRRWVLEDRAPT